MNYLKKFRKKSQSKYRYKEHKSSTARRAKILKRCCRSRSLYEGTIHKTRPYLREAEGVQVRKRMIFARPKNKSNFLR